MWGFADQAKDSPVPGKVYVHGYCPPVETPLPLQAALSRVRLCLDERLGGLQL